MAGSIRLIIVWLCGLALITGAKAWAQQDAAAPPPPPPADGNKGATPAQPAPKSNQEVPAKKETPPPADAVAATVNGQAIPEAAVYRALIRDDRPDRARVRREILNFLVDNVLVDQYLLALKIDVAKKDVEDRVEQLKKEADEEKQDLKKILEGLGLSEEEFRQQLTCQLRWDRFVTQQATDKTLKDFFDKNRIMFDGSQIRARHILVPVGDRAEAQAQAKTKAVAIKKNIEETVAAELAKLPPDLDKLAREKKRLETLDKTFAKAAEDHSVCPSKKRGGDLDWFPRAGAMVEPFAKAAFALRSHQISEPVLTEFGYHIILHVDYRPGKDVKFDEMKPFVHQIYEERMREAVLAQVKSSARITINPAPK